MLNEKFIFYSKITIKWNLIISHATGLKPAKYKTHVIKEQILKWMSYKKWRRGVVAITTAQLYTTKAELRLCADSNPTRVVSDICNGEDIWQ